MKITPVTCTLEEAKAQVGQEGACLSEEEREITVLVHPKYTRDQVTGVKKELDALSSRYNKELGGVVVAYEKLCLKSPSGWLFDTNPFIHLRVSAHFFVFCPAVGKTLKAVVRKKSPHHLGCLAHGSFNISVPRPAKESVEDWAGTLAVEGDTLTLNILFTSLTSYLMPFIRASIHPDCAKELQERPVPAAAPTEATTSTSAENDSADLPNTRTVFDDDSGISSNEADDNGKTLKRKRSEETNEGEEEEEEKSVSKKRKKEDNDGEEEKEEESEMKKKKKKRKKLDVTKDMGEEEGEVNEVRGKKRKRNEEEEEGEEENRKRKKKKKRESLNSFEAVEMERKTEEETTLDNITPSKKKKKDKNKKSLEPVATIGKEEEREEETNNQIAENETVIEGREIFNPLIKIKKERMSSDEGEDKGKKKKKKQQQQQEEEKEENMKKKKKKRESVNYLEAGEMERKTEETALDNITTSKKKKKDKKKKSIEPEATIEREENKTVVEAREVFNPLIKIKKERTSADEGEDEGKKKKKKQQQQQEKEKKEEEDDLIRKTIRNIKQEKTDENDRRRESISNKEILKMAVKVKKEKNQSNEAGKAATDIMPTPIKKKKKTIKEEKMSSDEGRSPDKPLTPLFMIKRENRIKAVTKKEKG